MLSCLQTPPVSLPGIFISLQKLKVESVITYTSSTICSSNRLYGGLRKSFFVGMRGEGLRTALTILSAVQQTLSAHGPLSITAIFLPRQADRRLMRHRFYYPCAWTISGHSTTLSTVGGGILAFLRALRGLTSVPPASLASRMQQLPPLHIFYRTIEDTARTS